jgi:hypothetical protein
MEAKEFLDNKQNAHLKKFGVYADVNSKIAEWMEEYAELAKANNMKEQDLIDLGFEKVNVSEEQSGGDAFYYYVYDIGYLSLISDASDNIKKNKWAIQLFDYWDININKREDLAALIKILESNKCQ